MAETIETQVARLMIGDDPSILCTDAYKFSMAEAGFPLRRETFYLHYRRGGPLLIPFDFAAVAREILRLALAPQLALKVGVLDTCAYLGQHGYRITADMTQACALGVDSVEFWAPPPRSWVYPREPMLVATGPSFLVSWLEPLVIMLHYPAQVAAAFADGRREFDATCTAEAELHDLTANALPSSSKTIRTRIDAFNYTAAVEERVVAVRDDALGGDVSRMFEVGLRSATCMAQHRLALAAATRRGVAATSNVAGAWRLGLAPVGTTGHEHQQRWGDDIDGFRAVRDHRLGRPTYLLDTYDAMQSGIPAALQAIREDPARDVAVRFDSGDQESQLRFFLGARDVAPTFVFEDGYTAERTARMETFAEARGVPAARRLYGYGGHFVAAAPWQKFSRDAVGAVWKLSETGGHPVMKTSAPEKTSTPGVPRIFRRVSGSTAFEYTCCVGLVGQAGEDAPLGFAPIAAGRLGVIGAALGVRRAVGDSPATRELIERARRERRNPCQSSM